MKKLLTLLTLCALPFFAIAQETITESAVQSAQTADAGAVANANAASDLIPISHLIGIIIAIIVLYYIGKKLYILRLFQIVCSVDPSGKGKTVPPVIANFFGFMFYCMVIIVAVVALYKTIFP